MPQGKRKDFSGKQKRLALLQKRASKQEVVHDRKLEVAEDKPSENETKIQETSSGDQSGRLIQDVPLSSSSSGKSKYDLRFRMENKIELAKLREDARKPLKAWQDDSEEGWELGLGEELFPDDLSFPKRPKWTNQMSKKEVEANESRTFREFVGEILDKYDQEGAKKKVSHFELNLETWRQLWRVIEMSDILLLVVDSR